MTPRRLRLLGLMARRETREISRVARHLQDLRNQERQVSDAAARLDVLLTETRHPPHGATTRGALASGQAVAAMVLAQDAELRARLSALNEDRRALETDLAQHSQRRRILHEHADATRRALARKTPSGTSA